MVGSDPHYSNAIDDQTLKKENSLLDFDFNCLRYSIVGIQRIRSNARRGPAINIEIGLIFKMLDYHSHQLWIIIRCQ